MSKISSKGQVTVPKNVRSLLKLKEGDRVVFKIVDNQVVVKKLTI